MLAIFPFFVKQIEEQTIGFELRTEVCHSLTSYTDFAVSDKLAAPFAAAKSLRLQDTIKAQFRHGGTLPETVPPWAKRTYCDG